MIIKSVKDASITTHNPWIVETDWLETQLNEPGLVVLDGSFHLPASGRDGYSEFQEARIPGAQFFDIHLIADQSVDLPHMLPSPDVFSSHVRKMGISNSSHIVVYDNSSMMGAARVWWMFRTMGFDNIAVLNGGFRKWQAENRSLETNAPRIPVEGDFTAQSDLRLVSSLSDIKALLGNPDVQIADARSARRFAGEEPEPREVPHLGHIPGSLNVPFDHLLAADGTLHGPETLQAIFEKNGLDIGKPV